jgi:uncharacterized oligopeptide transporter (OPT) family protein
MPRSDVNVTDQPSSPVPQEAEEEAYRSEESHLLHGVPVDESDVDRQARWWLANVYQGDRVRQLSVRSIVTGMVIGGVMSVSNLYVGLKTGWGLGVTVTACIIAYATFRALEAIVPAYRKDPFTILENYTMSSAASAAGYMSSSGLISAIPALYLVTGRILSWWEMMAWLGSVSVLGVFMAIPLKRQMINIEKLPFPTGIATAETLKSMHSTGSDAIQKAWALFSGAAIGAVVGFWRDGLANIAEATTGAVHKVAAALALPETAPLFPSLGGLFSSGKTLLSRYTFGFEGSLILAGAGAIMGIRVGVSLLVGAILFYGVLAPWLISEGIVGPAGGYKAIVSWTLWPAAGVMVSSGLTAFAFRWRTLLRAFSGLAAMFGQRKGNDDPLADVEVPASWFLIGTAASGLACVILGRYLFDITWTMGILAVLLTLVLSIVAARATGETDITPITALGKITQLIYGAFTPVHSSSAFMTTNLMTAMVTAGASSHSADLLTDLKSGYLLGGNPRKQTISQLFGVLAGTLLCVPVYSIIVQPGRSVEKAAAQSKAAANPTPPAVGKATDSAAAKSSESTASTALAEKPGSPAGFTPPADERLGSESMPAPSAVVWAGVAKMLANGVGSLPKGAMAAMILGALAAALLTVFEELLPRRYSQWLPSPTSVGIAGIIPAWNSIAMFLGALAAWSLERGWPAKAEKYTIPVSSGFIAGESLMGVMIIMASYGPTLIREIAGFFG